MKIHDDSKSYKCDVCLKVFQCNSKLVIHYRICNRKFSQKNNLVLHQATHSEILSFKCSIFPEDRLLKTKHQLNHHMVYIINRSFFAVIVTTNVTQKLI